MNRTVLPIAILALLVAAINAQADVRVTFRDADRFTDAGDSLGRRTDRGVLNTLERYLQSLGERELRPGQRLEIEISDVDLAGQVRPVPPGDQIRVADGLTPPRIDLSYRLLERGRLVASGTDRLRDTGYQMRAVLGSDQLAHEKNLLRRWFRERFGSERRS